MLDRFVRWFSNFLHRHGKRVWLIKLGLFLALFLPIGFMIYRDHQSNIATGNDLVFSRREAISDLAGTLLSEKFGSIIRLGIALSSQNDFQNDIQAENWARATQDLEHAKKNIPALDNIVLFDVGGTIMGVTPAIPEIIGRNYSYRDYYLGVSKNWEPYVSEVFKRSIEPYDNIISIAVPIRANDDQRILGIMLFTIKLDTVLDWAQEIDVGSGGFVYFTDQHGNVAGHPKYSNDKEVVSFANVPVVQNALKGESGVVVAYNPIEKEERISGYKQVAPYDWTVIVQQPVSTAFALTTATLKQALAEDIILGSVAGVLLYFLINIFIAVTRYYQKEQIYLSSIGDGLIGIDRSWNITLWNTAATTLTGWNQEEAVGKPFREIVKFINADTRGENIRFIEETMLFGKIHLMDKHTILKQKGGTEIAVADSASPIYNENGVIDGAIIIFRDNSTERKLEEARLEFSSLATHQLRTPITVINNFSDLLAETQLTAEQQEDVKEISKASRSLTELANGMLNVSRIESGTIGISPVPLYFPDIIDGTLKESAPEILRKQLTIEKKYSDSLPSINADENLVAAICRNLLSNAIKYTSAKGKITVAVTKSPTDIVLSVTDTGMGIPKPEQDKIFSKFFRAENAHSADIPGTGLGLYTIKAILKQAGGNIWFESEEGVGTSFHVSIPLSGMIKKDGLKGLT